jgi:imidazolonepropionase-like amidohydrolase
MKRKIILCFLIVLCFTSFVSAQEKSILIKDGKVLTMAGKEISHGSVLIQGAKIIAVGEKIKAPADAKIIDARGKIIMPGLIDAATALGLMEISTVPATVDYDEATDPSTPQMRVIDGINPHSELIPIARVNGITTVLSAPGQANIFVDQSTPDQGNVFSGQSAIINLDGNTVEEMVVKFPAALHINLGEAPKRRYGAKNHMPSTRMGIAALFRQEFIKAQQYIQKKKEYEEALKKQKEKEEEKEESKKSVSLTSPSQDLKMEALSKALTRELPVIVSAHRLDDITTALRLAEEFNLKLILLHGTEAYKIAAQLANKKIPVLVGPITTQPASMETLGAIYENAALLVKAGVKIAIQSSSAHFVKNLPYEAGLAVAYGLPREEALKAITINPAQILGVDDILGSLQPDNMANIIVVKGDPLEIVSQVTNVIINGKEIELTNRHIEIYKKYKTPQMP